VTPPGGKFQYLGISPLVNSFLRTAVRCSELEFERKTVCLTGESSRCDPQGLQLQADHSQGFAPA
jgi:hypothetical protein